MSAGPIHAIHAVGPFAAQVMEQAGPHLRGREVVVLAPDDFAAALPDVELAVGVRFPDCDWSTAGRLRAIHVCGSGVDGLLPARGLSSEVKVVAAKGLSAPAMAEFVLAQALALAKGFPDAWDAQATRRWGPRPGVALAGRSAVVVGAGEVGQRSARLLRAVGMNVTGVRRSAESCPAFDRTVTTDRLDDVLVEAMLVVLAAPATGSTRQLLNGSRLRRCPPGVLIVNVARGSLIEEEALATLLREGHVGGAALDVFEVEPLPPESPLWLAPRTLLTPHVSWHTDDYGQLLVDRIVENVRHLELGTTPSYEVDVVHGY